MSKYSMIVIGVLAVYMVFNLIVGIVVSKRQEKKQSKGFVNDYFIGGRSMGGLVLAMTLIATFASASSFIGGPGMAYTTGLVWVLLSVIQVPTAFVILGILGKKFAIISRKTNAVTITDYLKVRYKSPAVVILAGLGMVLFFIAQMISQFMGGAVLLESMTGISYVNGLILFGAIVILYTSIGGFKAVVTTDTIQAIIMVIGCFLILFTVVKEAGGYGQLVDTMNQVAPHWTSIDSNGATPMPTVLSFWVTVGVGVLGLPQTAVRCMGFKDTKSLHSAMIIGTIVVSILMFVTVVVGVFANAVITPAELPTSDYVIPAIVLKYMNPWVAGLFIAAPLSAVMSTVSSLLILASATIIKDIYLTYVVKKEPNEDKGQARTEKKIGRMSMLTTLVIGILVIVLTINPPDLIVWINIFAMGGLECTFLCPILFGLYWKKANATGCIFSIIAGVGSFIAISSSGMSFFGFSAIVPAIMIAVLAFVVGSLIGDKRQAVAS
jgi:sodium/pantothenate symporter